jgi:hypothetical protein
MVDKQCTESRGAGTTDHPSVEGIVLRQAEALARDTAQHPHAMPSHLAYLTGAIGLAVTLGYISDTQGVQLREACRGKLAEATPAFAATKTADLEYARLLLAVLRHGGASLRIPVEMILIGPAKARRMLIRMQRDGLLHAPDVWGFHAVRAGEA